MPKPPAPRARRRDKYNMGKLWTGFHYTDCKLRYDWWGHILILFGQGKLSIGSRKWFGNESSEWMPGILIFTGYLNLGTITREKVNNQYRQGLPLVPTWDCKMTAEWLTFLWVGEVSLLYNVVLSLHCTMNWISILDLPPSPSPPLHPSRSAQSTELSSCAIPQLPTSDLFHTWQCAEVKLSLPSGSHLIVSDLENSA